MLLGLLLTLLGSLAMYSKEEDKAQAEFLRLSERIAVETQRRFTEPEFGLKGARGFFGSSEHVSLDEFRAYAASVDLTHELHGVYGIGLIEHVQRDGVERFEAEVRREGAPDFAVKTSGHAPDLYIVKYTEPMADNAAAWGLDVGTEGKRRAAIEHAIASGKPTLTAPLTLIGDPRHRPDFLLMLPMYKRSVALYSDEDRRRQLMGVLIAPIVTEELLRGLAEQASGQLDIEVFLGTDTRKANQVYGAKGHVGTSAETPRASSATDTDTQRGLRFSATRSLVMGDRVFTLRTGTLPAFDAAHGHPSTSVVVLSGLALSTLMAWVAWMQASWRARAEARAQSLAT